MTAKILEKDDLMTILALIPAYNESLHIAGVVAGALVHLPVLVVDDGSTDDTAAQAQAAGATVLIQNPNQGKGAALQAGFRWAMAEGYEAVITLDADGQHNPVELPKFIQAYQTPPADLIIGRRDFSQMPPVRRLANWLGGLGYSWAVGQRIFDNQSGYRLISRRLLAALLDRNLERGFEYEVEMITICVRRGFKLAWVPIQTIYAGEASHIQPVQHTKNFLRLLWRTRQMR
ncbi:MAG: glycosyltransferase family 2 protein [Anaerolineales bacterium]|nr:glycosyltransferase family 2 protein [Anaerolineales bacterium]